MAVQREERRLAAILSADVVGYSRLMGADESATLAALKTHRRELIDPKIAEHNGRIVKLMGDGVLVEFASVVDAVQCAVEIQKGMAERNTDEPDDQRIVFRIGVNLGDVIIEGDDIHGDGVNVAARLEGLADPGGICVSGDVYRQCRGKLDVGFDDLGEQEFKNIADPVHVYRVVLDDKAAALVTPVLQVAATPGRRWWPLVGAAIVAFLLAVGGALWLKPWTPEIETASIERMALPLPDKPSIAVLPFDNLSGDQELEYFSDGMINDIITDLSRFSKLFVIASNTVKVLYYADPRTPGDLCTYTLRPAYFFPGKVPVTVTVNRTINSLSGVAVDNLVSTSFKLRLHQSDDFGRRELFETGKDQTQRNKGQVDGNQINRILDHRLGEMPNVDGIADNHPSILLQIPVKLSSTHVKSIDFYSPLLEQTVRKTTGRSTQINTNLPLDLNGELP